MYNQPFNTTAEKKIDILLELKYEATTMIRNVGSLSSSDRVSHPRMQASSSPVVCAVCSSHLKQFVTGYTTTDSIRQRLASSLISFKQKALLIYVL
jgi:hypothetical protein